MRGRGFIRGGELVDRRGGEEEGWFFSSTFPLSGDIGFHFGGGRMEIRVVMVASSFWGVKGRVRVGKNG